MAQFTLTVNAQINLPPNQIGNRNIIKDFNENHVFSITDFTNTTPQYQDPEGDEVSLVKIISLPLVGQLLLNGTPVTVNQNITKTDIDAGLLIYDVDESDTNGYADYNMTFDLADAGSNNFSGLTPGIIGLLMVGQTNQPPSQVGDNSFTIDYGESIVFNVADFTTNTTPPYSDPEGDAPKCLLINSLPSEGVLKLNNIDVLINQEILFTDIAAGLFTFTPNNSNTNNYSITFDFAIQDAGSGIYTE